MEQFVLVCEGFELPHQCDDLSQNGGNGSSLILYIGTLLMFFNWILCFLTVFAVIMYHLQIVNVEEDFLFATFGNEYLQYKKKVCRYIGRKR